MEEHNDIPDLDDIPDLVYPPGYIPPEFSPSLGEGEGDNIPDSDTAYDRLYPIVLNLMALHDKRMEGQGSTTIAGHSVPKTRTELRQARDWRRPSNIYYYCSNIYYY